ncbi:glycoside hydrolase family 17 protein [Hypholoma sublateritium FD-334 SS-4]|uniref:glucan endo-1,3-beta-D-glucosidase n=1 Tax=Hypholoma sublateritium (strain FD-334 SS-4) TaxID=945553 RepID=A0A0D2N0K0_HYPSF|nr:glycoside hydrolase family 17 protein [Hypholoma sublateritium FD-334 SS-4]
MDDSSHRGLNMSSTLEKQAKSSRKSKYIVIGSIVAVVVLAAVGTAVGVLVSKSNKSSSTGSSDTTAASSTSNSSSTSSSSSNDPSVFTKDNNLRKAFYGLAYTPEGSLPDTGCNSTLESVIKDVQLMSQLTSRIRLYGGDCNQSALVLEAVKQTKVDVEVFLGNFVVDGDTGAYERQRDVIKSAIETYGTEHIAGITVGNEFMLNYVVAHNSDNPNSAVGDEGAAILLANIADTRSMLAGMNLDKTIPVGNSDAGSYFNTKVLSAVDYGLSNVHAWFANTTAAAASSWVTNFFEETNVQPAALLSNKPKMYIAETGWPTASKDLGNANNGASDASIANLQIFLDTFVCEANTAGIPYFFFEFFDEVWKDIKYGGVEGHWGLFDEERNLKTGLTIPTCVSP